MAERGQKAQFFRRLSIRVVAISTMLVALALLAVSLIIVDLYRSAIERRFDNLLSAHLFSLVVSTDITAGNQLVGAPQIGEQRYQQPGTGWVWDVLPANETIKGRLASSFFTDDLPAPPVSDVPFDAAFERRYTIITQAGLSLRVLETEVQLGENTSIARFRVAGNLQEVENETRGFFRQIVSYLCVVGLLMIAINAAAIIFGLRPLDLARIQLGRVRSGETSTLEGEFPVEIEPLANEINALIDSNKRIVDRARVQVGDLAHALKTPLAVIINEANAAKTPAAKTIAEQAAIMRGQVEHYLQRARIAAQAGTITYRTEAKPVVDKMLRVFMKLHPAKKFVLEASHAELWFAGETQDFEEIIGNLLENAANWSRSSVRMKLSETAFVESNQRMLTVCIEDDGPGIPADKRDIALARGKRLDEAKPGTGLGLSIVAELVREYHGHLKLDDSASGGLKVTVALPLAAH